MSQKEQFRLGITQKINHLRTNLTMIENGLKTVGTKENTNLWLGYMRKEVFELQTLSDKYHDATN